ncbi:hypothetical protein Hanom_Chr14g01327981 [Helianthus anomalus]
MLLIGSGGIQGGSFNGFAHPYLAYMMFIPCSLAGMLFPRVCWNFFSSLSKNLPRKLDIGVHLAYMRASVWCLFLFWIKWRFLELVISCFYGSNMDFI